MNIQSQSNPNFISKKIKIYAISDSHQETRKTANFLSKIFNENKNNDNILFLNGGDIFKGVYPKQLERDSYLNFKELKPDIKMVMTLGNNDFGFDKNGLEYLIATAKKFAQKMIHVVCANIFQKDGKRPEWLKPYITLPFDDKKVFVTGFCINNINTEKFGIISKKQSDVLVDIQNAILNEKPDFTIVLNHDYMPTSKDIFDNCKQNGIKIDMIIGGHDHNIVSRDEARNIYYPQAFSESMYEVILSNISNKLQITNVKEILNSNSAVLPVFEEFLSKYEKESKLSENIAPCVLNLDKKYSKPCSLGSFLADNMKLYSDSDIAFFSTGFLMKPIYYKPDSYITNYIFQKAINARTPIKVAELSVNDLKNVFSHAIKTYGYGSSNPKFLQCSSNVKLVGKDNPISKEFILTQIYIDNVALLDENLQPKTSKKFKCCFDSYIAEGGQGFKDLQNLPKTEVKNNNVPLCINMVLLDSLKSAPYKFSKGTNYPTFEVKTI